MREGIVHAQRIVNYVLEAIRDLWACGWVWNGISRYKGGGKCYVRNERPREMLESRTKVFLGGIDQRLILQVSVKSCRGFEGKGWHASWRWSYNECWASMRLGNIWSCWRSEVAICRWEVATYMWAACESSLKLTPRVAGVESDVKNCVQGYLSKYVIFLDIWGDLNF